MDNVILGLLLLFSSFSHADEAFVGYGVGVFNSANQFVGQTKIGELGYRHFMYKGIYWQGKGGYWGEGSSDQTRKSGFFGSTGPGLEVSTGYFEARSGLGLAWISAPDSQLGANFPQFNEEFYVGLRDKDGNGMGLQYQHISCASFCSPNMGRDFVTTQLSVKF